MQSPQPGSLSAEPTHGSSRPTWVLAGVAFFALVAYSASHLWRHVWGDEAYAHGPLVLAICTWIVMRQPLPPMRRPGVVETVAGWTSLVFGLALYVVGRSQDLPALDTAGLPFVAIGVALAVAGSEALRAFLFPILFLFLLIPVPAPLLEAVTAPMRYLVSYVTESLLHAAGYPIGRAGVVITIGQYQLLVAEACSGINSLLSLLSMALLYIYLCDRGSIVRGIFLMASVVPIALAANTVRVMTLVLLTYHGGDELGQGFMHSLAGVFLFGFALLLLLALDSVAGRYWPGWYESAAV